MKIKRLLIGGLLAFATVAGAQTTFEEGGLRYIEDTSDPSRMAVYVVAKPSPMNPNLSSYSGAVVVPAAVEHDLDKYEVVGIAAGAFVCDELQSLTVSEGVERLAPGAIVSKSLEKLVLPGSMKNISDIMCDNLKEITFGEGTESIKNLLIGNIEVLRFPDSLREIEMVVANLSGKDTSTVRELNFGNNIETVIDLKLTYIGETLTLPASLQQMTGSLQECPELRELKIEQGAGNITSSLQALDKLESLRIPGSMKVLSDSFNGLGNLKELQLEEGIETISGSLTGLVSLKKLVIPNSVTAIKGSSFSMLENCDEIVFGKGWSDLERAKVFFNVPKGKDRKIYCPWTRLPDIPEIGRYVKTGEATLQLYVPANYEEEYLYGWALDEVKISPFGEEDPVYKGVSVHTWK